MMPSTGARIDAETVDAKADAVMQWVRYWRRANWKASWRRSTWKKAGVSKYKFRRDLETFVDGINSAIDRAVKDGQ